jgi:hypothetical protein
LADTVGDLLGDALAAGGAAAVLSGLPSTVHALVTGGDPLAATRAAGAIALPREGPTRRLLAAAVPVHLGVSLGWAVVLAAVLPRRRTVLAGAAAGLAIAAVDVGTVGRRVPRLRALPIGPQLADHVAYGAVVGAVLANRRQRRSS